MLTDGRNPVAVELAAGFVREWPGGAGTVEQATYQADADLAERTARAAAAKPNVILIAAGPADFGKAAAQLESAGPHAPLLYGGEDVGAATPGRARRRGDGHRRFLDGFDGSRKGFCEAIPGALPRAAGLAGVSGLRRREGVVRAMSRAGGTAADHVRDRLASTSDFECLTGPLRFKDGRARRRVFVVSFHDGQAKTAQVVDPEPDAPPKTGG